MAKSSKLSLYLRGTGASVASTVVQKGSGFASVWLLNRILSKGAYGDYEFAFTTIAILLLLGSGGFNHAVMYRLSRLDESEGKLVGREYAGIAMGWSLLCCIGVVVGINVIAPYVIDTSGGQHILFWLSFLSVLIPLRAAKRVYKAWYQARQRIPEAMLFHNVLPAACKVLFLAGVWLTWPTPEAVVGAVLLSELGPLAMWYARSPVNPLQFTQGLAWWDVSYSLKLALTSGVSKTTKNADLLMVGLLAGSKATAEYAIASRLAALLMAAGHNILNTILRPRLGRLLGQKNMEGVEREYNQVRLISLCVALALGAGYAVAGETLLGLFGAYQSAYPLLLILAAGYVVHVSFGMSGGYLNIAGYAGWTLATMLTMLGINVALNGLLIPVYGANGAALATLISYALVNTTTSGVILHLDGIRTYSIELFVFVLCAGAALLLGANGWIAPALTCAVLVLVGSLTVFVNWKVMGPMVVRIVQQGRKLVLQEH